MNSPAITVPQDLRVQSLFVASIMADPHQVRREFDREALDQLAESIKANGIIQPIVVRPAVGTDPAIWKIIAGERRWRAAKIAGLEFIPAVIREDLADDQAAVLQVLENLQRADLSLADTAAGVSKLVDKLGNKATAEQLGKSPAWVSKHAAVQALPAVVLSLIQGGKVDSADTASDLAKLMEISPDGWRTRQALKDAADGTLVRAALRQMLTNQREEIAREEKRAAERAERQKELDAQGEEPEPTEEERAEFERGTREREEEQLLRDERDLYRQGLIETLQPILTDLYANCCEVLGREPLRNDEGQVERPEYEDEDDAGIFLTETVPSSWRTEVVLPKTVEDCKIELHVTLPLAQLRRLVPLLAQLKEPPPPRQNTSVKEFLKACVLKKKGSKVQAQDLYQAYATWCTDEGRLQDQLPFNSPKFGDAIAAAKIEKIRSNGIRYVGISLKA